MDDLTVLYQVQMNRLEQHARSLLERTAQDRNDLWNSEVALLRFQVELQVLIVGERSAADSIKEQISTTAQTKSGDWKSELQWQQGLLKLAEQRRDIYDHVLVLSRRLGDAWAWLFLHLNQRIMQPLTQNQRVPSVSSGYALQGMLAIAEALNNAGAGFPILHDMTDCLRIGDITFVQNGFLPLTIEVKTHLGTVRDGRTQLFVEVHFVAESNSDDIERWEKINLQIPQAGPVDDDSPEAASKPYRIQRVSSQLRRQLNRMIRARSLQKVDTTGPVRLGSDEILTIVSESNDVSHHWDVMKEVVKRAKQVGFAYEVVDDAFVYTAMYSNTPLLYPFEQLGGTSQALPYGDELVKALSQSSIWYPDPARNRLWFDTSWSHFGDRRWLDVLPMFLYPFPSETVLDIIWQRLAILVFVNLGKVVQGLQDGGLNASLPQNEKEFEKGFLGVSREVILGNGQQFKIEMPGLSTQYASRILHDCLSLTGFVDLMLEASNNLIKHIASSNTQE